MNKNDFFFASWKSLGQMWQLQSTAVEEMVHPTLRFSGALTLKLLFRNTVSTEYRATPPYSLKKSLLIY